MAVARDRRAIVVTVVTTITVVVLVAIASACRREKDEPALPSDVGAAITETATTGKAAGNAPGRSAKAAEGGPAPRADAGGDWQAWWAAREAALERVLGPSDGMVRHAVIPFEFGPEKGGAADVLVFREHGPGLFAATAELIGRDDQLRSAAGNYELLIAARDDIEWGSHLISVLAYTTLEERFDSGHTLDISPAVPPGSTITALLFVEYARFEVRGRRSGLLLGVGITADELDACLRGERDAVLTALVRKGVYPYTDLRRASVLAAR